MLWQNVWVVNVLVLNGSSEQFNANSRCTYIIDRYVFAFIKQERSLWINNFFETIDSTKLFWYSFHCEVACLGLDKTNSLPTAQCTTEANMFVVIYIYINVYIYTCIHIYMLHVLFCTLYIIYIAWLFFTVY